MFFFSVFFEEDTQIIFVNSSSSCVSLPPSPLEKDSNHSSGVSVLNVRSLLKGHCLPFSAIFFSLDQVEGYRRVFSVEDTSYVSLPSPWLQLSLTASSFSAVYAIRMYHVPPLPPSFVALAWYIHLGSHIGMQSMNAFRYRIPLSITLYSTHHDISERCVIFHLLLRSGPPSAHRQFHHCPLVVGSS